MKKVFLKTVGLCAILTVVASCTKTTNNYYTTNNGTTLTGNVQGIVSLYDQTGTQIIVPSSALSGDTIAITNNTSGVVYKAITDATGTYKFTNLNAGTYSFVVTKPGYGLTKYFGFEFVGGGTTYKNFSLAQIPSFNVSTAQTVLGVDTIIINGTVPHQPFLVNIKIYVSIPSHTSVNENAGNYSTVLGNYFSPSSTSFSNSISTQNLYSLGFTSGSTVYFALYICNMNGSSYQDPITGLLVSTALSSTPVIVSAIVP